jgi:large subunit ribosomal protein L4
MMATAKSYEENGTEKGTVELPDNLFGCEINASVMHQAVVAYLANQRQGTAATKERADVRGGGRKPFRQKGTGRARAGTIRSPIYRGGGVVFGPHPRSYRQALPKKVRRLALRSALSSRAKDGAVVVVDDPTFTEPKTKRFAEILGNMNIHEKKILFVTDKPTPEVIKSARNIQGVRITQCRMLTTYDVLWADKVILTRGALKVMEEVSE